MKRIWMMALAICAMGALHAQPPAATAESGKTFGDSTITANGAISVPQFLMILRNRDEDKKKMDVKLKCQVVEVSKTDGSWIKVRSADNQTILVKMKDHKFAVPLALNEKVVVIEGAAEEKVYTIKMLIRQAEEAKKSKEEIEAILEPKKEITIEAKGVLVL